MVALADTDGEALRELAAAGEGPILEFTDDTVLVDLPRGGFALRVQRVRARARSDVQTGRGRPRRGHLVDRPRGRRLP